MKTPKKPSKEPTLPKQDEYRRANVLREEMLSQFRTFGEALSGVREDVASMKPELREVKEYAVVLKLAAQTHTQEIRALKDDVSSVKGDVSIVKSDVAEMKTDLKRYNH